MNIINDGKKHKIVFAEGKLFIDEVEVSELEVEFIASTELVEEIPLLLEINVHDSILGTSVGPGQK